jgi:predicted nucleic acid-binding protein
MDKLFLDANVVVDFLCERSDFYLPAARLMVKSYNKEVELCCSTLTLATASYFMERSKVSQADIFHKISDMISICEVADVDRGVVEQALSSGFTTDFEDALQYFSAKKWDADIIITRNKKDFANSQLPVYEPLEYLELENE